jgi:hypothetical protein
MKTGPAPLPPLKAVEVLDQFRERIANLHHSLGTEEVRRLGAGIQPCHEPRQDAGENVPGSNGMERTSTSGG